METVEKIERQMYCNDCKQMRSHEVIKKKQVVINNVDSVVFYKKCWYTHKHQVQELPLDRGFKTDSLPVAGWNALMENEYQ
jgi:hypothetical protein